MSNHRDTSFELRDRKIFSGSDQFMQGGHQIINSNLANARAKRKPAKWAMNDKDTQQILMRAFPRLDKDDTQRKRAGRWLRVIQLFYRSGMSYGDVAGEMGETTCCIRNILRAIRRCASGRACNSSKKFRRNVSTRTFLGDL